MKVLTESVETGRVKWFSSKKGYGFIIRNPEEPEEKQIEIFVHFKNIQMEGFKTLLPGLKVEFEVGPGQKNDSIEAKNVRIVT